MPVIGIIKRAYQAIWFYITATMKEVDELVAVGSDIIAADAPYVNGQETWMSSSLKSRPNTLSSC